MAVGVGPFDVEKPLGLTEYGGGAGLVEGSPESQSGKAGLGSEHLVADVMPVDEKIGIDYRTPMRESVVGPEPVDPQTGLPPVV